MIFIWRQAVVGGATADIQLLENLFLHQQVKNPIDGDTIDRLHALDNMKNIHCGEGITIIADRLQNTQAIAGRFKPRST